MPCILIVFLKCINTVKNSSITHCVADSNDGVEPDVKKVKSTMKPSTLKALGADRTPDGQEEEEEDTVCEATRIAHANQSSIIERLSASTVCSRARQQAVKAELEVITTYCISWSFTYL